MNAAADDAQRRADDNAAGIQRRFPHWSPAQCVSYAARLAEYHDALEALPLTERTPYPHEPPPRHEAPKGYVSQVIHHVLHHAAATAHHAAHAIRHLKHRRHK